MYDRPLRIASLRYCAFDILSKNAITSYFRCFRNFGIHRLYAVSRGFLFYSRAPKNSYTSYLIIPLGARKRRRENSEIAKSVTTLRCSTLIKMSTKLLSSRSLHRFLYNTREKRDYYFLYVYFLWLRKNQFGMRSKNIQLRGYSRWFWNIDLKIREPL